MKLIGAIDQGTSSTRFIVFNHDGQIVAIDQLEHKQILLNDGWVEHNALEIWDNSKKVIEGALKKVGITGSDLAAIGITNQRETTVLWDAATGKTLGRSLVWNDARTHTLVEHLSNQDAEKWEQVRKKCGLSLTTYFSGVKIRWLLENDPATQAALKEKRIMFGTVDSWLIWNLTGGVEGGIHVTDVTNASRTMLMNLETLEWDKSLFEALGIPFEDGIKFPEISERSLRSLIRSIS